jgi:RNA polymerase sigma-70 factor (ECF subfamily)
MVTASQSAVSGPEKHREFATEDELLAACKRRDMSAFEHVYRMHGSRLKSIAHHILRNRQDAEDAVQETFLKLYRGIDGFQGNSGIGTWLCRIAINVSYDVARRRQREPGAELPEHSGEKTTLTMRVALEDALGRIHPKHRMVFLLFEVEGLKHSEIAAVLEVPEGTSKAWLFEAKKELKRMLMEERR